MYFKIFFRQTCGLRVQPVTKAYSVRFLIRFALIVHPFQIKQLKFIFNLF